MPQSANGLYQSNGMISSFMPQGITARENMMYQEYLSNTALQRQMADAQAAGLNPWLMHISGASTPSGSTDSAEVLSMLSGENEKHSGSSNAQIKEIAEAGQAVENVLSDLIGGFFGTAWGKVASSAFSMVNALYTAYPEAAHAASAKTNGTYMREYSQAHGYAPGEANKHIKENVRSFFNRLFHKDE